ncbi:HAMP domain-containing protein [candidate division KSB1 bacterium]|nr:HAMP domain-containing protein [candidate division KSB1 bacterium]
MKLSLRLKFAFFTIFILLLLTAAASLISTIELQKYYRQRITEQLESKLEEILYLLNYTSLGFDSNGNLDYVQLVRYAEILGARLTLVDSAGTVIFDSKVKQDSLIYVENHLDRPEFRQAQQQGIGSHQRTSATVNVPFQYVAVRVPQFSVKKNFKQTAFARLALPVEEVQYVLRQVRWKIFAGGGIALIFMTFLSYYISKKLTYPLSRLAQVAESVKNGSLEAYFERTSSDEVGDLADLLNGMLSKLRQDLVKFRKLEKVRTQFLGNVSHELRTPIFTVQGYLETLLQNPNIDKITLKNFLAKAFFQTVRLNNLLKDLIDISRIESGEMKLNYSYFDVAKWLQKLTAELLPKAQENNLHFKLFADSDSQMKVYGDQEKLSQVIINLVENAIKYNKPGGSVELGFIRKNDLVTIYISDTGMGIEKEHIPRIFERFYRVDKERSRAVGGTGLGLAIVKHIIQAHNSSVIVESSLGEGSKFSFDLKAKSS